MTWASRYIQELKKGHPVTFKARGNSMAGKIANGQEVTIVPVARPLEEGDVVLCRVHGSEFLHLISGMKKTDPGKPGQFQISNASGHVNGWTTRDKIYGVYEPTPKKEG